MKGLIFALVAVAALAVVPQAEATVRVVRQRVVVQRVVVPRQRVVVQQVVAPHHVQQFVAPVIAQPVYGVQQFVAPQAVVGGCSCLYR